MGQLSDLAAHAGYLSTALDGAIRAYGALWARQRKDLDNEQYLTPFSAWAAEHKPSYWQAWDLDALWKEVGALRRGQLARARTKAFIDGLVEEYRKRGLAQLPRPLENLLVRRERLVKPGRARLSGNATVNDRSPASDGSLGFRWWQARTMLEDVRLSGGV